MRKPTSLVSLALVLSALLSMAAPVRGETAPEVTACRSVHLQYPGPQAVAFYNEVTVDRSAEGTYFCACGFTMGYYGIQELGDGKKVVIFSVWEGGKQNDPNAVDEARRVKLVYKDDKVRTGRFGGEGTGGQSFLDYDWKVGQTYRFLATAVPDGDRTAFAAWFWVPESGEWKHLATFSTLAGGKLIGGGYSFIEDFRRDKVSATKVRKARFGNGWMKAADGAWLPVLKAGFTADGSPATTIDAGVDGDRFFLATGGDTKNAGTPLGQSMDRPPASLPPPSAIPGPVTIIPVGEHKLDIRPALRAEWGASLADVQKVLESAAMTLWPNFPERKLQPILVEPKGGPITLFQRGPAGEFQVRLATGGTLWAQYSYQFAHEFCHIMCHYVEDEPSNKWFEESLCEMASIYALRQMSETWKKEPPYPNWRDYSKALYDYAEDLVKKGQLPPGQDLAAWYKAHEAELRKEPCNRDLNRVVSLVLLPMFEEHPGNWEAVATLNAAPVKEPRTFAKYLSDWYGRSPAKHQPFIREVAAKFGVEIPAASPAK